MVTAVNLGASRSLRDATRRWVSPFLAEDVMHPDAELHRIYDACYSHYHLGYRSMSELWTALAKSNSGAARWPSA
jgi:hypothetical protein